MHITPTRHMLEASVDISINIPARSLAQTQTANILDTLQTIATHDWGLDPYNLRTRADDFYKLYTSRIKDEQL
jgi:hypothetical protein